MEKEKRRKKRVFSLKKKIDYSIDPSINKNTIKKNKTFTSEQNDKKKNLAYLKFKQNILVWLLKKSKYSNNQKESSRNRKGKNRSADKSRQNHLSEKYKNIPGIDKLQYLTEQSLNELLNRENQSYSSAPISLVTNKPLKNRIIKYSSAFQTNTKKSLNNLKSEFIYKVRKLNNPSISLALDSYNKKNNSPKNKANNNKFYHIVKKEKFFINNKAINNYINDFNISTTNKKININSNNRILSLMNKQKNNKCFKLYSNTNEYSEKVLYEDTNYTSSKRESEKRNKRIFSGCISRRKSQTHQNLFDENNNNKKATKNKSYIINIDNNNKSKEMKKLKINNLPKTRYFNRSSQVDRLIFKLEFPNECFEDNVYTNKPEDKFISLKNQIAKQKSKTIKMFNDYKMALKLNERLMTKYIYKLVYDKIQNKIY